ncbi:MAG: hypothetical protein GQ474_03115 [Sulfurimonas sp.]|nr:hypothetical protein [Sulfurimonas sp.]
MIKQLLISGLTISILTFSACSQKSAEYGTAGAVTGAVGAGMVGALTDLIIDGKVNPQRLQRNLVSGAIAGGATGAIIGQNEENKSKKKEIASEPVTDHDDEEKLKKKIGDDNYVGLEYLISCKHSDSYRMALKASKSSNITYELTAYALQALVDRDRNNASGETHALESFIAKDEKITSIDVARGELDKLYEQLQDERRIRGQNVSCQ